MEKMAFRYAGWWRVLMAGFLIAVLIAGLVYMYLTTRDWGFTLLLCVILAVPLGATLYLYSLPVLVVDAEGIHFRDLALSWRMILFPWPEIKCVVPQRWGITGFLVIELHHPEQFRTTLPGLAGLGLAMRALFWGSWGAKDFMIPVTYLNGTTQQVQETIQRGGELYARRAG